MAIIVLLTVVTALIAAAHVSALGIGPCACYKLTTATLATCQKKSVFTVTTPQLTLNDDCSLVPEGCFAYTPFNASNITAVITNPGTGYSATHKIDGCKLMTVLPQELLTLLKILKIDISCPILAPNKVCFVPPVTNMNVATLPFSMEVLEMVSKMGPLTGTLKAKHSLTQSSCLKFAVEVKRDPTCPVVGLPTVPTVGTLPTLPTVTVPGVDVATPTVSVPSDLTSLPTPPSFLP